MKDNEKRVLAKIIYGAYTDCILNKEMAEDKGMISGSIATFEMLGSISKRQGEALESYFNINLGKSSITDVVKIETAINQILNENI